jgi:hypothetical protein
VFRRSEIKILKSKIQNRMWYLQESNQGHTDFQSVALPSELRYLHGSPALGGRGEAKVPFSP